MKKFIASVLGTAILLSSASMCIYAEGATSSVYTIDTDRKVVKGVSPFTTVQTFEANFSGGEVEVVNVDGSLMADNAYATENVYARIDGDIYRIDVDWPYDSVQYYGRDYRSDGDVIFTKESAQFNSTVDNQPAAANSGFAYATSGYKLGYGDGNYASVTSDHRTTITKRTNAVGEPIYEIANNAPRYAFLRSHYSSASYESGTQSALTDITKGKISVTTATFKANQMGNFSIFHNTSGYATGFKGDRPFADFTYTTNPKYIPNAVHFTEDGTIKVGGTYVNGASADQRTPANTISGITWEAGREYTVSIIQKVNDGGSRYANVYGIYLNGQKIYPYSGIATDGSHFTYNSSTGAVSMTTRGNDYKYNGGISAVLVGAAPQNANDDFKVDLSDLKVYTISAAADYKPAMDADITLTSDDQYITIDNKAATVVSTQGVVTADRFTNTGCKIAVNDNVIKVVSDDGLTAKAYSLTSTGIPTAEPTATPGPAVDPESTVYTVDTVNKTISKVKPMTTVADFLANFENGSSMSVVNIDGSVMSSGYATENVSLQAPNGDLYAINVSYPYSPVQTYGDGLADDTELYDVTGNQINGNSLNYSTFGFTRLEKAAKFGYGSDAAAPENTESQVAKATKQTRNGETVYVVENDTANYAFMRSHYTSSTNYSTDLNNTIDSWTTKQIVTKVEFEADELGNISVFNNTPVRNSSKAVTKGDSGIDALIYSEELPYVPNSVHFLEDGSVKLGGFYANYTTTQRTPIQTTDFTWQPGHKYTVSIVQRYLRGTRNAYVDGVYINGTKVFPNANTVSHGGGRVALQGDGTFKIGSRGNDYTHGGGLSSIMIGTAPQEEDENFKVYFSDVKLYETAAYDPAADADITVTSTNEDVSVDNENAVISCAGMLSLSDLTSSAKMKIENGYLKAVSADGLVSKTYTVMTDIVKGFYNGVDGSEIATIQEADTSVCFKTVISETSAVDGSDPVVMLAVYNKTTGQLINVSTATGTKNANETTTYNAVIDLSDYDKSNIELRGFIWADLTGESAFVPLAYASELK